MIREEEAIKMAKADLKCMERDTSGQDKMCNSHKCDECSLNYERGNIGEQKEWLRLAIKALEQQPKTGHWIVNKEKSLAICSNCKFHLKDKDEIKLLGTFTQGYNYCPTCGAKMQEAKD